MTPSGAHAEDRALDHLRARGLVPVARNYRCRSGEIDLIMGERETLVFVEVRYRSSLTFGGPLESVTPAKQRRILAAARHYLQSHPEAGSRPCRFDVVAISPRASPPLLWVRDAFQSAP
ncbi:MAG: YraN family protein [Chromatiales bacterium]|jgi:putative endonuclease